MHLPSFHTNEWRGQVESDCVRITFLQGVMIELSARECEFIAERESWRYTPTTQYFEIENDGDSTLTREITKAKVQDYEIYITTVDEDDNEFVGNIVMRVPRNRIVQFCDFIGGHFD